MRVLTLRLAAISLVMSTFACVGSGGANIPDADEQKENRDVDFDLFSRGFSYFASLRIVASCTPSLAVVDAYPGIDPNAKWGEAGSGLFLAELQDVSWTAPGITDAASVRIVIPTRDGLAENPINQVIPADLVLAFRYSGPSGNAKDAQFACGDTLLTASDAVAVVRPDLPLGYLFSEEQYGVSRDEALSTISKIYTDDETAGRSAAPQEAFVDPIAAAVTVVGPVNWPPSPLNFQQKRAECGHGESRPYYCG